MSQAGKGIAARRRGAFMRQGRIKTLCLTLLSVMVLLSFSLGSCAQEPAYDVDTYDELKEEFADYPHVKFPDISAFKEFHFAYSVLHTYEFASTPRFGCTNDTRRLTDYFILGGYADEASEKISTSSGFFNLDFTCRDEERPSYEREIILNPNTVYRNIEMGVDVSERDTEDIGTLADEIPKGAQVYHYSYQFKLDGAIYTAIGYFVILPEDLESTDIKLEEGRQQMLALVDSIIDQQ